MAKTGRKYNSGARSAATTKYDDHHSVMAKAYGSLADLRRELADSREDVEERRKLLDDFAHCSDPQRAWLLLDDYFNKLSLDRKALNGQDWWSRLFKVSGEARLEETAMVFFRCARPLPKELSPYANFDRFRAIQREEENHHVVRQLEEWLFPAAPVHLDSPRASLRVIGEPIPDAEVEGLFRLQISLVLHRPRTGEKMRRPVEIIDLTQRSAQEQELFSQSDWSFIKWLADRYGKERPVQETLELTGLELMEWLVQWGGEARIELAGSEVPLEFHGRLATIHPDLIEEEGEWHLTQQVDLDGHRIPYREVRVFSGSPVLVLNHRQFYVLRNSPPESLLAAVARNSGFPVVKLSHRLLTQLRRRYAGEDPKWDHLCITHAAEPRFLFEMNEDTVSLRLLAVSESNRKTWQWNGREWTPYSASPQTEDFDGKPEVLDDPRLEPAVNWLRRLDWFTPEPGLWVGDAKEEFLNALAAAWEVRPESARFLGNPTFHRLFLGGQKLRPRLTIKSSGIDWFSVSAEWEQEGMRLTPRDLQSLQGSTGRFVKLPDSGWVELDCEAVQAAQETFADLGLDGLVPVPHRVDLAQGTHLDDQSLQRFQKNKPAELLREKLAHYQGIPATELPASVRAELRPYQLEGFHFLANLSRIKLGGILADDMGLGKTLQTLATLEWARLKAGKRWKPVLVICPASVLHNWRRESEKFTPDMKVLVLESGAKRHNLRGQIPEHDLIITNYALLRRDLSALKRFEFSTVVLDEAQFIKNPSAQVTQSVKQLRAQHRLALTGTPLENRILDLWSIVDFVQPGYLGEQSDFLDAYEANKTETGTIRIARRRLSARLRPILMRRLKRQVACDLPERIEERRDCTLGPAQRKLYLAELRRSREQVQRVVTENGMARSKIHVLAALTRLRQICCHPGLVGSNARSGKTETLFELVEPLLEQGQKVLLFSQFVKMLELLRRDCSQRDIKTYLLTGETKNRQHVVQSFQEDPEASVFLLSLRAAGTGLNLTTASYVVLYDPWWNPAVEAQAVDRSHRIGQTATVNAYKLIAPGTVEEKIWELQQRKADTISDILGEEGFTRSLTQADLDYLFATDEANEP